MEILNNILYNYFLFGLIYLAIIQVWSETSPYYKTHFVKNIRKKLDEKEIENGNFLIFIITYITISVITAPMLLLAFLLLRCDIDEYLIGASKMD